MQAQYSNQVRKPVSTSEVKGGESGVTSRHCIWRARPQPSPSQRRISSSPSASPLPHWQRQHAKDKIVGWMHCVKSGPGIARTKIASKDAAPE